MSDYVDNEFMKIIKRNPHSNVFNLIKDFNCKLLYADLDMSTGGCTQTNNRCHTIIVNSNWSEPYQHFVILHEFSHIKMHPGVSTPFYRNIGLGTYISKMEWEANTLAMKLLLHFQDGNELEGLTKYQIMDYLGLPNELSDFL